MREFKVGPAHSQARRSYWPFALLMALALLPAVVLARGATPAANPGPAFRFFPASVNAVGDPVPRIQCGAGYTATLYAEGLSSPDGLAFSPDGVLYVAEETAGRVSRVEAYGSVTTTIGGLSSPEGIAFDDAGNLYVVEDVAGGRLIKMSTAGVTTALASGLDAPEGVVWASDGTLYITESNAQFTPSPFNWQTRVTAISSGGVVTPILTDTVTWSYAGIVIGPDGLLYVTNELSGDLFDQSIVTVDPDTGASSTFATDLFAPEGLRFSAGGGFPLYVVEEDTGGGAGRLSRVEADGSHTPFCSGFDSIEDVALDEDGRLYVSEDGSSWVILIATDTPALPDVALSKGAVPPDGSTVAIADRITYTLTLSNNGTADATGLVLTDSLPAGVSYVPGSVRAAPDWSVVDTLLPDLILTGTLSAGDVLTVTFGVTVTTDLSATITNTAWLVGDQVEMMSSNTVGHLAQGTVWRYIYLPLAIKADATLTYAPGR